MRHLAAWSLLSAAVLAGCRANTSLDMYYPPDDEEYEAIGDAPALLMDPAYYEEVKTSELGTEKTRGIAKTVDWIDVSTTIGTTYMNGGIGVESIERGDADNFYSARVLIKNRNVATAKIECKIAFFNAQGDRLIGVDDFTGDKEVWQPVQLEGLGSAKVTNSCRVKGAVSFRLHVRAAGASDDGLPDQGRDKQDESIRRLKELLGE
jgi:hypothetical protein